MNCTQDRLILLLQNKNPSVKEHEEIVRVIREGGHDMPDALFEHAYMAQKKNPRTNQSTSILENRICQHREYFI